MTSTSKNSRREISPASASPTSNWQPSALDVSSPTYTGPRSSQRAATQGRAATSWNLGRAVMLAVAIVGLIVFGFFLGRPAPVPSSLVPESVAVLELIQGPVDLYAAEASSAKPRLLHLSPGEALAVGTVIETRPASATTKAPQIPQPALASYTAADPAAAQSAEGPGRAAFRLSDGASVRLDSGSRVRLATNHALVLEQGAVYIDSAQVSNVEVRTTLGTVRDIGTQFEVRLVEDATDETALRVRVREGLIVLRHEGDEHQAGIGSELTLHDDGSVERNSVAIFGPHWDWILETAMLPKIEGQKLSIFLDWLSRESGWSLNFADPGTANLAANTVLHGSLGNLSHTEAMAMVFESSGLDFSVAEGELLVFPATSDEN